MAGVLSSHPAAMAVAASAIFVFAEVIVVISCCIVVAPEGRPVFAAIRRWTPGNLDKSRTILRSSP